MPLTFRPVSAADLDAICQHREAMFHAMGYDEAALAAMREPSREWHKDSLANGSYFGFLADADGEAVGCAGAWRHFWPPSPAHPTGGDRVLICNVHVTDSWRGRGIARRLMELIEAETAARGIAHACLHASDAGRPLYANLGWQPAAEMVKNLTIG